jgi:hypothetical protein
VFKHNNDGPQRSRRFVETRDAISYVVGTQKSATYVYSGKPVQRLAFALSESILNLHLSAAPSLAMRGSSPARVVEFPGMSAPAFWHRRLTCLTAARATVPRRNQPTATAAVNAGPSEGHVEPADAPHSSDPAVPQHPNPIRESTVSACSARPTAGIALFKSGVTIGCREGASDRPPRSDVPFAVFHFTTLRTGSNFWKRARSVEPS